MSLHIEIASKVNISFEFFAVSFLKMNKIQQKKRIIKTKKHTIQNESKKKKRKSAFIYIFMEIYECKTSEQAQNSGFKTT